MKWFKHITDSLDDPFIEELLHKFGAKGYLVFFGTIEIVARECRELDSFVKLPWRFCHRKVKLSRNSYETILNFCATSGRFEIKRDGDNFLIRIPKLAELKDNYTQDKLGRRLEECFQPLQRKKKKKSIEVDIDGKIARTKPTYEDVCAYCLERGNRIDPERFFNYYESNGWRVGRNPMKDWKACVRTWEKNDRSAGQIDKSHVTHQRIMATAQKIKMIEEADKCGDN